MESNTENPKTDKYISTTRGCCFQNFSGQSDPKTNQQRCCKLSSYNWLNDVGNSVANGTRQFAEVRFKNGRKDFFHYPSEMILKEGELVAVEANPGHDIGIVSLTGDIVRLQMARKRFDPGKRETRQIFRHARTSDIERWLDAAALEESTMFRTRVIAMDLGLEMKINDVEYQGDRTKAIFYYTASERVDFRLLIRKLAEVFRVRIEMRQIGMRQEAAKLGGIGSCGRELCCASWMSSFSSVSTNSARIQQLSLNPQKLAGQCGKLKCCLNYEVDSYLDSLKNFPDSKIKLNTRKGEAYHQKSDVFRQIMWYAYADSSSNMMALRIDKVKEIMQLNKQGKIPADLESYAVQQEVKSTLDTADSDDYTMVF